MGSKIYVGGLPYSTTEQQLSDLFAVHGAVTSSRIITDKFTGQSRGFGFVEMSSDSEAQAAITALNGTELGGCRQMKDELKECKECGQKFCRDCGNYNKGYCDDCKEYEKYDEAENKEEKEEDKEVDHEVEEIEQEEIEEKGD